MALVRRMYEDTAVPVREIARRAGVTERTFYKYARKNGWKPRYAWTPDGSRPPGRPARTPSDAQARAVEITPVKGASGRFIRREDRDAPVAHGIAALDPAARAAAAQACSVADRTAKQAALTAKLDLAVAEVLRAQAEAIRIAKKIIDDHESWKGRPEPDDSATIAWGHGLALRSAHDWVVAAWDEMTGVVEELRRVEAGAAPVTRPAAAPP